MATKSDITEMSSSIKFANTVNQVKYQEFVQDMANGKHSWMTPDLKLATMFTKIETYKPSNRVIPTTQGAYSTTDKDNKRKTNKKNYYDNSPKRRRPNDSSSNS